MGEAERRHSRVEASAGAKAVKGRGGNSLATHWLALHTFTNKGMRSIPGRGTKNPQSDTACPPPQKKVKKESSPGKWKAVENYGYYFNYYHDY